MRSHASLLRGPRPVLLFKRKFLAAIRSGEKTQTIRVWKHRMMRAGQRSYIPGVGGVRITEVTAVDLESLTDADARPDGFPTAEALRRELASIYGEKLKSGYEAFRVCFEIPRDAGAAAYQQLPHGEAQENT